MKKYLLYILVANFAMSSLWLANFTKPDPVGFCEGLAKIISTYYKRWHILGSWWESGESELFFWCVCVCAGILQFFLESDADKGEPIIMDTLLALKAPILSFSNHQGSISLSLSLFPSPTCSSMMPPPSCSSNSITKWEISGQVWWKSPSSGAFFFLFGMYVWLTSSLVPRLDHF